VLTHAACAVATSAYQIKGQHDSASVSVVQPTVRRIHTLAVAFLSSTYSYVYSTAYV
jgi:hypothetical protein